MKLIDTISWLMGRVQRSLFPHLNQCLTSPLTEQEERLVSILEILQIERHVPRIVRRYRYPGRKPLDRQACARVFVAKALYRHPTTSDLLRALQSTENLRRICGFTTAGDIPSESTLSRSFAEFAVSNLGGRVHDALVKEYLAEELVGHISRDSTAIVGREKPAKKKKEPKKPRKRGRPARANKENRPLRSGLIVRSIRAPRKLSVSCRSSAIVAPRRMPKGTKSHGTVTSCIWTPTISACRSVPLSPLLRYMTARQLFR